MSRFDKIFEAREGESIETEEVLKKAPVKKSSNAKKNVAIPKGISPAQLPVKTFDEEIKQPSIKRGRPPAKRSDPDFVGLTTYVRRDTHTKAKIALLQEGKGRELSELVEDLISDWLKQR